MILYHILVFFFTFSYFGVFEAQNRYVVNLTQMGIEAEASTELIARAANIKARAIATEFEAHLSRALRQPEGVRTKKVTKCVVAFANVNPTFVCRQLWEGGELIVHLCLCTPSPLPAPWSPFRKDLGGTVNRTKLQLQSDTGSMKNTKRFRLTCRPQCMENIKYENVPLYLPTPNIWKYEDARSEFDVFGMVWNIDR